MSGRKGRIVSTACRNGPVDGPFLRRAMRGPVSVTFQIRTHFARASPEAKSRFLLKHVTGGTA